MDINDMSSTELEKLSGVNASTIRHICRGMVVSAKKVEKLCAVTGIPALVFFFPQSNIDFDVRVSSAHRTPEKTIDLVNRFEGECIIVGAGAAAHLAGVVAAHTIKPVIAVPINATALNGVDALYATVMMPSGIPVATMAIDGSKNAALFALSIMSLKDPELSKKWCSLGRYCHPGSQTKVCAPAYRDF